MLVRQSVKCCQYNCDVYIGIIAVNAIFYKLITKDPSLWSVTEIGNIFGCTDRMSRMITKYTYQIQ